MRTLKDPLQYMSESTKRSATAAIKLQYDKMAENAERDEWNARVDAKRKARDHRRSIDKLKTYITP